MQEAPPSQPAVDRPRRRWFLVATFFVLLTSVGGAIWIIKLVLNMPNDWSQKGTGATLGRCGLAVGPLAYLFIRFGMPYIKKCSAAAEIERLLPEFAQVSDHFQRPKHFVHNDLLGNTGSRGAERFIRLLGARSDGSVKTPEIDAPSEKKPHKTYRVTININDKLFTIYSSEEAFDPKFQDGNGYYYQRMLEHVHKTCRGNLDVIHVRVEPNNAFSNVKTDDFSLTGIELEAFVKTLELSRQFFINPTFW